MYLGLFTTKVMAKANNSSFFANFAAEKKCPTGWQEWSGYCYMLVQQEETYGGAKAFCQVILHSYIYFTDHGL